MISAHELRRNTHIALRRTPDRQHLSTEPDRGAGVVHRFENPLDLIALLYRVLVVSDSIHVAPDCSQSFRMDCELRAQFSDSVVSTEHFLREDSETAASLLEL